MAETAQIDSRAGETATSMVGRKNIYTCTSCGAHIVTEDRDEGVTPFMIACRIPAPICGGMMQSSMYYVFDQRMLAGWEWYKPTAVEVLTDGERDHVERGGLLLRRKY